MEKSKKNQSDLDNTNSNVGDKSQLDTTDKSSIVNAVNEVKDQANTTGEGLQTANNTVSNLQTQVTNMASGSPKGTYDTYANLQTAHPAGDTGIYIVTNDSDTTKNGHWFYWNGSTWADGGVYQSAGIADKTITPDKTTFAHMSKNLFNKDTAVQNSYVATNNGSFVNGVSGYTRSNYIPIEATKLKLTFTTATQICFYDSSKNFISGLLYPTGGSVVNNINIPSTAVFCVFSCESIYIQNMMVNYGSTVLPYEDYDTMARFNDNIRFNIGVYASFSEMQNEINKLISNSSKFEFLLPENIYLNDNAQFWCYWNNIIHMHDILNKLPICPYATGGDSEGYGYNNDKLIVNGKFQTLELQLIDYSNIKNVWDTAPEIIASQNIQINSKNHNTAKEINTIIVGDSYMAVEWGEGVLKYMKDFALADGNNINFKGTKNNYGDGTLLSESIGGWTESQFHTSPSSPFVFGGSFDFAQYLSANSITNIDNIVFFLGINGGNGDDINAMIANIKATLPNVKIFICMVPSGALEPMVTSNWYSQVVQTQRTRNIQNLYYLQKFDNRQAENIYLVPTHAVMDRIAGIRSATYNKYQFPDINNTQENLANDHHPTALGAKALSYLIYNYLSYFAS